MGSLLSRFRKQPTTIEQLKKIEDNLKTIEDYKRSTERKQKRTVANVIIYGAALYILASVIVFVWYLPESSLVRLCLLIPLILVPVIIYWMKRLISRYFNSKMVKANEDYADLQRKKTDIINTVMETETFNKAKEILTKYAPEKLEKKLQELNITATSGPGKTPPAELRKRTVPSPNKPTPTPATELVPKFQTSSAIRVPTALATQKFMNPSLSPRMPLPQPLFSKERSFSDKLVEYIVGDGPSYRYALICKYCMGHNGMALKEEFPYLSFKCCYCMAFNAARNQRPSAPRLDVPANYSALPAPERKLSGPSSFQLKPETEEKQSKEDSPRLSETVKADPKIVKILDDQFPNPVPINEFINDVKESQDPETGDLSSDKDDSVIKSSELLPEDLQIEWEEDDTEEDSDFDGQDKNKPAAS